MPVITSKSLHAAAAPIENGDIVGISESASIDDELGALRSREPPPTSKSSADKGKSEQDLWGILNDVPAPSSTTTATAAFSNLSGAVPAAAAIGTAAGNFDNFTTTAATPTAANDLFGLLDTAVSGMLFIGSRFVAHLDFYILSELSLTRQV